MYGTGATMAMPLTLACTHTNTPVYDDHSRFFLKHNDGRREDFQVHLVGTRISAGIPYMYTGVCMRVCACVYIIISKYIYAWCSSARCVPTMMFVLRRVPFFVFIHPGLRYFSPYISTPRRPLDDRRRLPAPVRHTH